MNTATALRILTLLLVLLTAPLPDRAAAAPQDQPLKRYALIVGANDGGPERSKLRYAVRDAETLRQVLQDLGGIEDRSLFYLSEPDGETLFATLNRLGKTVQSEKSLYSRSEFIFYYSGHSDERHILFAQERIPYSAVRSAIETIATDVRIVILDSCASGAFTRAKGGTRRPPFILDKAYDMKGFAFMSSSSSDEASQESERLKGSFFTHNLVAGLRGAADMNQDGRITLTEAYQYSFDHTLSQTANTISGPQHPHKTIQMEGTGDVVITDLRRSPYRLVFEPEVQGTLLLRTVDGQLIVELHKSAGREMEIGLEAGVYQVINIRSNQYYDSRIELSASGPRRLSGSQFTPGRPLSTQARGDSGAPAEPQSRSRFRFALLDKPGANPEQDRFVLHLLLAHSPSIRGLSLGSGIHIVSGRMDGVQLAGLANSVGADMHSLQLSGLFNSVRGHSRGAQISGAVNFSGSVEGLQLSGGLNFTPNTLTGVQIGPVNIAKTVHGAQIGLVNISGDSDGFSLGLLHIAPGKEIALSLTADDARLSTLAVKTGTGLTYNLYMTGMDFSARQNVLGLGWGVHALTGRSLGLDLDVSSRLIFADDGLFTGRNGVLSALRGTLLFRVGPALRLGAGVSVNHYHASNIRWSWETDVFGNVHPVPSYSVPDDTVFGHRFDSGKENQLWVGLHLGIEYVLKRRK